jgi:hypothetical protein
MAPSPVTIAGSCIALILAVFAAKLWAYDLASVEIKLDGSAKPKVKDKRQVPIKVGSACASLSASKWAQQYREEHRQPKDVRDWDGQGLVCIEFVDGQMHVIDGEFELNAVSLPSD